MRGPARCLFITFRIDPDARAPDDVVNRPGQSAGADQEAVVRDARSNRPVVRDARSGPPLTLLCVDSLLDKVCDDVVELCGPFDKHEVLTTFMLLEDLKPGASDALV